jgi:hypothetical protein
MQIQDFLKHNWVIIPVVASILFGTVTGIKYVIDLTNTIDDNNQRVARLLTDLESVDDKYKDKIDDLREKLSTEKSDTAREIGEVKAGLAKLDSALRMGEDLYRVLADQVREQSYEIKDLNR